MSRQSCEENDAQVDQVLEEPDLSVQMNQDPISFIGKELTSNERHQIITQGANQPRQNEMINKEFPKSMLGSRNRSFNESWYSLKIGKEHFERKWLSYSPTKDAVFCHFCILFGNKNKETTFTQTGLRDWKKAQEKLTKHEKSQSHVEAAIDFANYCHQKPIKEQLSMKNTNIESERQLRVKRNREVMKRLIEITICLAEQGLAFRSHREDITDQSSQSSSQGNFLALVKLLAKYDETLSHHLTNVKKRKSISSCKKREGKQRKSKGSGRGNLVTFLSAESQNKLINSIANKILHVILDEIKTAHYYSIAMDSTTDRAKKDQLSCIIRYIDKSYDVVEKLICVKHIKDTSAKGFLKSYIKTESVSQMQLGNHTTGHPL